MSAHKGTNQSIQIKYKGNYVCNCNVTVRVSVYIMFFSNLLLQWRKATIFSTSFNAILEFKHTLRHDETHYENRYQRMISFFLLFPPIPSKSDIETAAVKHCLIEGASFLLIFLFVVYEKKQQTEIIIIKQYFFIARENSRNRTRNTDSRFIYLNFFLIYGCWSAFVWKNTPF